MPVKQKGSLKHKNESEARVQIKYASRVNKWILIGFEWTFFPPFTDQFNVYKRYQKTCGLKNRP